MKGEIKADAQWTVPVQVELRRKVKALEAKLIETELDLRGMTTSRDSFRAAYHRLKAGDYSEVLLNSDGGLDEIVGAGVFHIEQMDTNHWFVSLAGCRFSIHGKKVELLPVEVSTWTDEKARVESAEPPT